MQRNKFAIDFGILALPAETEARGEAVSAFFLQRALKQDELAELRHRIDLTARPIGTHDVIIP